MSWFTAALVIFIGIVHTRIEAQYMGQITFPLRNIQNSINFESNYSYDSHYKAEFQQYFENNNGFVLNLPKLSLPFAPNPFPGFIDSPNVVTLNLRENGISRIVPGSFESLPYMKFLDLSRNKLAFCDFFEFGGCAPHLQTLVIEENQLPGDNLNHDISKAGCFPNVEKLYIRYNHIRRLKFCLKKSFPRLVSLHLTGNEIDNCNFIYQPPASLAHLYVEHNEISSISTSITQNLETLKADYNRIRSVCYKSCDETSLKLLGTTRLKYLSLSENRITQIEACAFRDSFNLVSLNLTSNSLTTIYPSTFASLRFLTQLHLDSNLLSCVPNLSGNWHLKTLSLRNNRITQIRRESFTSTTNLQKLYLGGNQIQSIKCDAFTDLTYLQELDLSYNQLQTLSSGWMRNLMSLKLLDLRSNRFTYVSEVSFSSSLSLCAIYLQGNRFAQSDRLEIQRYCPNAHIYIDDCSNRCISSRIIEVQPIQPVYRTWDYNYNYNYSVSSEFNRTYEFKSNVNYG